MARNDGIDRTSVRNVNPNKIKIGNTQRHNEREKDSYTNPDIVPERTALNIHFKEPSGSYSEMFAQMETDKVISTRGLKDDAQLCRTFTGKLEFTQQESEKLKQLARNGIAADSEIADLKCQLQSAKRDAQIWKRRYEQLLEQTKDFLAALKRAPEKVRKFISRVLHHAEEGQTPIVQRQRDSVSR